MRTLIAVGLGLAGISLTPPAFGIVEVYKTEAEFLDRLDELGLPPDVAEGFETADWDASRYPALPAEVTSQGVTWSTAARDVWTGGWWTNPHGLSTNNNWARSGQWGLFENHSGSPYPTTIRVSGPTMFALGGWFNTNPDLQSVGFLFDDRDYSNSPGYVLPGIGAMYPGDNPAVGHEFVGFVDPDGFNSVILTGTLEVNEKGFLEGGIYFGADDFVIVTQLCRGDANSDRLVDFEDLNLVLAGWGTGASDGDVNGDGSTDFEDLNEVLAHWGQDCN